VKTNLDEGVSAMRSRRLRMTDLAASVFVGSATAIYIAGATGADIGGPRARAGVVFMLGLLACVVGGRPDATVATAPVSGQVAALRVVGVSGLVFGLVAVAFGSADFLMALIIAIDLLWVGATLRHATTRQPSDLRGSTPRACKEVIVR
jgi:hypothetical protein